MEEFGLFDEVAAFGKLGQPHLVADFYVDDINYEETPIRREQHEVLLRIKGQTDPLGVRGEALNEHIENQCLVSFTFAIKDKNLVLGSLLTHEQNILFD